MVTKVAVLLVAVGMVGQLSAQQPAFLARFDAGVGVIPVANGAGPVNADGTFPDVKLNIVRGVVPGGGPWRIDSLRADIGLDGHISINGRGLLLASGNSLGTNAGLAVFATLICEPTPPFIERSTAFSVPLEANGDFRIEDTLGSVPSTCASPVLLIRAKAGVGPWLAAGIAKLAGN